ncbi:hypothetical protein TSUD_221810 [Trifolium subterraneum]|uniref:Uncharacterized protein n=1 Tax=Trifolium subterraneum TaxID=3900 RepID=A0A2Z6NEC6_TRISU|nr:hypothetical protein TSUD_221810 [Trifolium subterraneum]
MNDPKYAYPYPAQSYPAQGYYQGPPVMAPPQYAAPPPRRQSAGFLEGCRKERERRGFLKGFFTNMKLGFKRVSLKYSLGLGTHSYFLETLID